MASPPRSKVRMPSLAVRQASRRGSLRAASTQSVVTAIARLLEHGGAGEQHGHGIGDVLSFERGRGAVGCLGHRDRRVQIVIQ